MFSVSVNELNSVLRKFGIPEPCREWTELQRYHYERDDPNSKELRLIGKAVTEQGRALVIRFKNEADVSRELIEAQSRFAVLLAEHGVETPRLYSADGAYARWERIGGYDAVVTVEEFVPGELRLVDETVAGQIGALLARMHRIAETADAHVANEVLFDPLARNDLFRFEEFTAHREFLEALDPALYQAVVREHDALLQSLACFREQPRFAVQGDLSNCNLYQTAEGVLGVFDFNRCGDNLPYFDAVMQAVFVARLMDYPEALGPAPEAVLLPAFLQGYHRERPFTERERAAYPSLYALISAFWLGDLKWNDGSLDEAVRRKDEAAALRWMQKIYASAIRRCPMPLEGSALPPAQGQAPIRGEPKKS